MSLQWVFRRGSRAWASVAFLWADPLGVVLPFFRRLGEVRGCVFGVGQRMLAGVAIGEHNGFWLFSFFVQLHMSLIQVKIGFDYRRIRPIIGLFP